MNRTGERVGSSAWACHFYGCAKPGEWWRDIPGNGGALVTVPVCADHRAVEPEASGAAKSGEARR